MFPVIDFRNGRYQGQTKDHLPHGFGCFMDRNFMFSIGEWVAGELQGNSIIFYPSGVIFYGRINFRDLHDVCHFELAEDHVQLVTYRKIQNRQKHVEKTAAILPLFKIILDVDSTDQQSKVLGQYAYSSKNEEDNVAKVTKILDLDKNQSKKISSCNNFIEYFQTIFYNTPNSIFQFLVNNSKGKKEYFLGLKGQGLGIKVQPTEQLGLNVKMTGKVYFIRGLGYFTRDNQLKDIGIKMIDSSIRGALYQQGVFSLPKTIIKYEKGKRPINCAVNFNTYIKKSLFYRDKILNTSYLYDIQAFTSGFDNNLRKVQTQKVAQQTIENPVLIAGLLRPNQQKRMIKQQPKYQTRPTQIQSPSHNPYYPIRNKEINPEYNLGLATDDIYRSVSKKKHLSPSQLQQYKRPEYVDPNYKRVDKDYGLVPIWKRQGLSPKKYSQPIQDYPARRDYNMRESYDYDRPYRQPPNRYVQRRQDPFYGYQQEQYPDSLYPKRSFSPSRAQGYPPKYEDSYGQYSDGYDYEYGYRG